MALKTTFLAIITFMLILDSQIDKLGGPGTLWGQLILLVTFLVNIITNLYKERRNRRWALEDAERQRKEDLAREQRIKQELASKTEEIKATMRTRVSDLGVQLDALLKAEEDVANERRNHKT